MNDKLEQLHGLQLSTLMDGELAPDEARFLLRRLQHDSELADCWERWQLAGEVMRGRAGVLLPDGFAGRVATALHAEAALPPRPSPGRLRWGGLAALAASIAMVVLMVPRPAPEGQVAGDAQVAASGAGQAPARGPEPDAAQAMGATPAGTGRPAVEQPVVAPPTAPATRVVASIERPVRAPGRDRVPVPADASPRPVAALETGTVAATPTAPSPLASQPPAARDPFRDATLVSRPWPRAVLPQYGHGGALATGMADSAVERPSFYPFEPRLPAQHRTSEAEPQTEAAQPPPPL